MSHAPFSTEFAASVHADKYGRGHESWAQTSARVTGTTMGALADAPRPLPNIDRHTERLFDLTNSRHFIPGGRYLYACGNDYHQTQNCLLLRAEDTREGWADLSWKAEMSLLTGAGIGIYWGALRAAGAIIRRTGGKASGPVPKMVAINELGRAAVQGGNRRSAIWAGLPWDHPDIESFIRVKDWPEWLREQKDKDPSVSAPMDMTNISVCLNDHFFEAINDPTHADHTQADRIYRLAIRKMVVHGEPGFSVDIGAQRNEQLRNACTEIVSEDDSDICNLGGLVLSRFDDPQQFAAAVRDAALFLTAGTLYSDIPYQQVAEVREKNRRLGLDVMGVHEFCLKRGVRYGSDESFEALEPFMIEYDRALEYAWDWQDALNITRSVAATSGAPTGTRAIVAETTTGWQRIHAPAYERAVLHDDPLNPRREIHTVIDPTVSRGLDEGWITADQEIDSAFESPWEESFKVQAYAQSHTDQAISMTVNLPHQLFDVGEQKDFGDTLLPYLPKLRGITVYPDGARAGQPITPINLQTALGRDGVLIEEEGAVCAVGDGAC